MTLISGVTVQQLLQSQHVHVSALLTDPIQAAIQGSRGTVFTQSGQSASTGTPLLTALFARAGETAPTAQAEGAQRVAGVAPASTIFDFPGLREGQWLKVDKGSEAYKNLGFKKQWGIGGAALVKTLTASKLELDVFGKAMGVQGVKRMTFELQPEGGIMFKSIDLDSHGVPVAPPQPGTAEHRELLKKSAEETGNLDFQLRVIEQGSGKLVLGPRNGGLPTNFASRTDGGLEIRYQREGNKKYALVLTPLTAEQQAVEQRRLLQSPAR